MENVLVIGASANEERYSNKAMKMLASYLHNPIPVSYTHLDVYKRQGLNRPRQDDY